MQLLRILKHLFYTEWLVRRAFPSACQDAIAQAIRASEQTHAGEVRFAVEGGLEGLPLIKGQSARERALEVFSQLRVWDTEENNGVLIYVLLADHAVEIVADRGIHARVNQLTWNGLCQQMQLAFAKGEFQPGAIQGIEALGGVLGGHFPRQLGGLNELPDTPVIVG